MNQSFFRVIVALISFGFIFTFNAPELLSQPNLSIYAPSDFNAKKIEEWKKFNNKYENKWRVKWHSVTGTPQRISGHFINIPEKLTKENIETVTRRFLVEQKALLQVLPENLTLNKADFNAPKRAETSAGTWYVYYLQSYHDIPVYGGSVRLIIRDQKITTMGSNYYPGIDIPTEPRVSNTQATAIVQSDMAKELVLEPVSSKMLIFPISLSGNIQYNLAWQITMPVTLIQQEMIGGKGMVRQDTNQEKGKEPVQWRYYVDALTGQIIKRINILETEDFSGTVTGMVHPQVPADTPVSQSISNMTTTISQGGTDFTSDTNVSGGYNFMGLAAGPANIEAHFTGPHVIVHNNETPDPDATHTSAVTVPGLHDWNWDVDDPSPNDVETNAFYHVNWIRDWYLQIDPALSDPTPYPMQVYVRDGAYCNASAGSSGLFFGSGISGSCEDFSLCSDISYHEYTHRIVHKVYDDAGVPLPYSGYTGAMNEGWADYFGGSATNDPSHGEGCYSGRNIDTPDAHYPEDWGGEVHHDGVIFSGAVWDTRTALGSTYVDALALRTMKDVETNFNDYLGAMLEEDDDPTFSSDPAANNNPVDGTPNIDAICHAFFDMHGIYHSYCNGHTQNPVAIITLPDPMAYNLFNGSVTTINIEGIALGTATDAFANFVLEYAHESSPTTWLTTGMTLVGGGSSPVNSGSLGQLDLTGLADGVNFIRLTVTTAGSVSATSTVAIVIDRALMTGWPQMTDTHFYSSPAVADIDPLHTGLEVAATGTDGQLYVWHSDGTLAPGWPKSVGYSHAAPAVGDLDGDGALEIIVHNYYGSVYAYHQDGTLVTGWPKSTVGNSQWSTTALADLDGDGHLEVVVGSTDQKVYAWHHDGTSVTGWPVTVSGEIESSPAVGDLDGDGSIEVVIGSNDGNVHAWSGSGTPLTGWPKILAGTTEVSGSAALGDLDGDGDLEIVIGTKDFDTPANQKVYAWHHDGTAVTGWPKDFPASFTMRPGSIVLADLDSDGNTEVLAMANNDNIYVWKGDGTPMAGWPPSGPGGAFYEFTVSSPVVADLDGDADMEVVEDASYSKIDNFYRYNVYAFHHNGTSISGWPKTVKSYSNSSPAIADIDQDGDVEVLIGSDGLFVWDLPGSFSSSSADWPFYRHDIRRTGTYGPKSGVALLFDTSGSMSWRPDGTMGAPITEQRLTYAKEAAYPFMEMLNDFNSGKANFGIANFPPHPWSYPIGCNGQIVTPMTLVTNASKTTAVSTTIFGLVAEGNTPLLAGMNTAANMLGVEQNQAIVLLSDGYHNCPSFTGVGDPQVTELISQLNAKSIRVFTIGFGRPTDVDHPLLEALADQTTPPGFVGSQFYDVTTPAFDPATWNPAVALQETYKNILVDVLGLEAAIDPRKIIKADEKDSFDVQINEHDRKISFYISWATSQPGRLGLTVRSSDGQLVPLREVGVTDHSGNTYRIITVDRSFLSRPGKVGSPPWKMEIEASGLEGTEQETYQYSVIMDSALKMNAGFNKVSYGTGDTMTITAKLTAAGQPVTGLNNVQVKITQPKNGSGNWFAANKVSAQELNRIPEKREGEILSLLQRKAIFLSDIRNVAFPGRSEAADLPLYDDGSHGDATADDGIYTNLFSNTAKEGTYSFMFEASGPTAAGAAFERIASMQKYVTVNVTPESIKLEVIRLKETKAKLVEFKLLITPKDTQGNFLGPRYAGAIKLTASKGRFAGAVQDHLDGTYSQILQLPSGISPEDVDVQIAYQEAKLSFNLAEKVDTGINITLIIVFLILALLVAVGLFFLFKKGAV